MRIDGKYVDIKKMTATEIIEQFDLTYYKKEIEELDKRIRNIRAGRAEFAGIYNHTYDPKLSPTEAEKRIKELERAKEANRQKIQRYADFIEKSRSVTRNLDEMAREDALLNLLRTTFNNSMSYFNPETRQIEKTQTDEKYGKKVRKIVSKERGKLSSKRTSIERKMYWALKKYAKKIRILDGYSISSFVQESTYSLENLYSNAYRDMVHSYEKDSWRLGVDTKYIERAEAIFKNRDKNEVFSNLYSGDVGYKLVELKSLQKYSLSGEIFRKVSNFINSYEQILQMSKEVECLFCILQAFKNTEIKDSSTYLKIKDIFELQQNLVRDLRQKTQQEYEKSNIPTLIEMDKKLSELYMNYRRCVNEYNRLEENNAPFEQIVEWRNKADDYRYEMIDILLKYPELNRFEYGIDIKAIKADMEKYREALKQREEAKKQETKETIVAEQSVVNRPVAPVFAGVEKDIVGVIKDNNKPRRLVTPYAGEIPKKMNFDLGDVQTETIEDEELRKPIEVPDYLSGNITVYYQQYMKEKLLNTELGKLKFSEFLEHVRPDLTELIEIERKREQRVETIYRKYLKYRIALKDKENAMSFKEFAKYNYGLENYEIPEEYNDTIKKR